MTREECDGCGEPINGSYVIDNDLILCPACFLRTYRESIEKYLGVVVCKVDKEDVYEFEELP